MYALPFYLFTRIRETRKHYTNLRTRNTTLETENTKLKTKLAEKEKVESSLRYEDLELFVVRTLHASHTISSSFYTRHHEADLKDYNRVLDQVLKKCGSQQVDQTVYIHENTTKVSTVYQSISNVKQFDSQMSRIYVRRLYPELGAHDMYYQVIREDDPIVRTAYINRLKRHIAKKSRGRVYTLRCRYSVWVFVY